MEALRRLYRLVFAHKIGSDFAWTFGSFAILAASGILINLVIAFTRDAAALGVFNIAYAVYLIGSQVASLGIHYSVLRHAAYHQEQPEENGRMLCTAMLLSVLLGVLASAVLFVAAPFSVALFDAPVADALRYAALGLALFPLNKVLISYANSLRQMKAFAVLQSIRYLTVLAVVSYVSIRMADFTYATLAFLAAELLTTLCSLLYLVTAGLLHHLRLSADWLRKHIVFGSKGVMAGIFLDLNTRLDVLVLGALLDARAVGIYSFAAMLIDGVQHILAIVRVNFNPMLVKALRDRDHALASRMLRLSRKFVTLGTAALCLCLIAGFAVAVHFIIPGKGLEEGLGALLVLTAGFTVISSLVPFDNLLMVSGHPGYQTGQTAMVTAVNVACCLLLVPPLGIEGAALATIVGYMAGFALLLRLSPRLTGWDLVANRFTQAGASGDRAS